jgi:hypothetical protein
MAATATVGYGVGARLNVAKETTYGTLKAASSGVWLAWTAESLKRNRPSVKSTTITGSLEVQQILQGRRSGGGDIMQEVDGSNDAYLWNLYANNAAGNSYTVGAVTSISSAPTLTPASGSGNAAGTYFGVVQAVLQKTSDSSLHMLSPSAESSVCTTSGGSLQINWAWTDPTGLTLPEGYTYYGTILWKAPKNGGTGTEVYAHFVSGSGNAYSDTASGYVGSGVCPTGGPTSFTVYEHVWVPAFTPGNNPQIPFSAHLINDNNKATYFVGGRATGVELVIGAGNEPVKQKTSMLYRDWNTETNPSYSAVSNIRKFMSWQSQCAVNGVYKELIEAYTITGKMTMTSALVGGLSGLPRYRDVGYGEKAWEVGLTRGFEDSDFVDYLNAGNSFSIQAEGCGQPLVLNNSFTDGSGNTGYPFRYSKIIDIPALILSEAGGSVGSGARIMEPLKAEAQLDATAGYSLRSKHYNATSTY